MAHENTTPKENCDTQIFSEGEANDEIGAGPAPGKISEIEDCRRPVIFFALEMLDAEDLTSEWIVQLEERGKKGKIPGLLSN
jgi:hypothetical protein